MADRRDSMGDALSRIESYQYPATHTGHLSQGQTGALAKFKEICVQKGYYTPGGPNRENASHDDETLLRYLRARKFLPQDAFTQFKDTEDWRKTNRLEELYETIDVTEYDDTRRLYPQWTGRRDKRGIPVYVFEVSYLTSKRMSTYEKSISGSKSFGSVPPKLMRLFALYENLLRFALPLCSGIPDRPYGETPVSQSNNIVDISGVGLKQFWNLKQHMQDASTLATAHYPETLDRIFILGAPSFFPTVWGWIKRWFDPITVSKIFILPQHEMKSTLEKYIDLDNVPKKYGGRLDWEWGQSPNLDPAITAALHWENPAKDERGLKGFPLGPVRWERNYNGDMVAVAVGSVHDKQRKETVATLPIKSKALNLPVLPTIDTSSRPPMPRSTTGVYTHPDEGQQHYPKSGNTPTEEHDEEYARRKASIVGSMPIREAKPVGSAHEPNANPRSGTSATKYMQQDQTHARGQLAGSTPEMLDHGYGDKTSTVEPSTVGQAQKDIDTPYAASSKTAGDNTYLGQAKALAGSAYTVLETAETKVMAAVGYGDGMQSSGGDKEKLDDHASQSKAEDPRVDGMTNQDVEDFIRNKYATHDQIGKTHHN